MAVIRGTGVRVAAIVLLTLIVLVGTVTLIARLRERRSTEIEVSRLLSETERHIASLVQERERFAYAFAVNRAIVGALDEKLTVQADYDQLRTLIETLAAPDMAFENLHSVQLVSYVNESVFSPQGRTTLSESRDSGFLDQLRTEERETVWIANRTLVDQFLADELVLTHVVGLPVTSQNKRGWLVFNYRVRDFLSPVLNTRDILGLSVSLVNTDDAEELFADSDNGDTAIQFVSRGNPESQLVAARRIESRGWTIVVRASADQFRGVAVLTLEIVVLALILSLVTALAVIVLAGAAYSAPIRSILRLIRSDAAPMDGRDLKRIPPRILPVDHLKDIVEETVARNRQYEQSMYDYDRIIAAQEQLVREKALFDLVVNQTVSGTTARNALEPYIGADPGVWHYTALVVRFQENAGGTSQGTDLRQLSRSRAAGAVNASDVLTARLDHVSYLCVVVYPANRANASTDLVSRIRRVTTMLFRERDDTRVRVGIGRLCTKVEELNESFREAMAVLDSLRWESGHAIQNYDSSAPYRSDPRIQQEYATLRRRLLESVRTNEAEAAEDAFKDIVRLLSEPNRRGAFSRTMMLGQLARDLTLENAAAHSGVTPPENSLPALNQIRDHEELLTWMESLVHDTISAVAERRHTRHFEIVRRALEYVDEHFDEPITLQVIRDRLGITMSHFGKVFREQTGTTFHKHLMEVRVARASEMLLKTDYPIRVVATECGFENQQNLIRVFKQRVGSTPTEYRRCAEGLVS